MNDRITLMIMMICLFVVLSFGSISADPCGDSCKDGETCMDDGRCIDRSLLVDCGMWSYCTKGDQCCHFGCIPEDSVCCNSIFYCDSGHTCCSIYCCVPGSYCDGSDCKKCENGLCNSTTPTTVRTTPVPFTTRWGRTTRQPYTRPPSRTTRKYFTTKSHRTTRSWRDQTESNFHSGSSRIRFSWWNGLIISAVVIAVGVIVGFLLIWKRRKLTARAGRVHGSGGRVIGQTTQAQRPQQTYTANPNYGMVTYTVPTNAGHPPPYASLAGAATDPNTIGNH